MSTELLSRFSRYLSISLHRSFVRTEQLSRLPRFLLCYPLREGLSKASVSWFKPFLKGFASLYVCILNYSQGFQKIFSALSAPVFWYVQALQGKALFIVKLPDAAHFQSFKPHPKGSARLQGFTLRGQYFFSRALQGFSKASLSLFKPSSQGPCKVCMTESNLSLLCLCDPPREGFSKASVSLFKPFSQGLCKASARDPSFCSKILVKGYAREGFNERSSSSFIQSDTVPETNRYALPTS